MDHLFAGSCLFMLTNRQAKFVLSSLIVFVAAIGLLGGSGFVYATDRTVVGELWSMDN